MGIIPNMKAERKSGVQLIPLLPCFTFPPPSYKMTASRIRRTSKGKELRAWKAS
jgi:hypothetical protein